VGSQLVNLDLAKLSNVADLLALEGAEVGVDAAALQVDDTSEWLVEQGADGEYWKITGFGSKSVDHGFQAHIDLASANDLRHILILVSVATTLNDNRDVH